MKRAVRVCFIAFRGSGKADGAAPEEFSDEDVVSSEAEGHAPPDARGARSTRKRSGRDSAGSKKLPPGSVKDQFEEIVLADSENHRPDDA